jgi:hypothetical protein
MPQILAHTPSIIQTIGSAVGPAALITTTAILLSGYTSKYSGISDQLRRMTAEYRNSGTEAARRLSLKGQLRLFHKRINALWAASTLLSLALIAFIVTVLTVLLSVQESRLGPVGVGTLLVGLILVAGAVGLELYEIGLARLTVAGELADIFAEKEKTAGHE